MFISALAGGLFVGVLSALPFVNVANCCCLWLFTGGVLAGWVLQLNEDRPIGAARGAITGCLAGLIGAGVWLIASILLEPLVAVYQQQAFASLTAGNLDLPPDVAELFNRAAEPGSAAVRLALGFLVQLFVAPIVAAIGGVVASTIFRPLPPTPPTPPDVPLSLDA